MLHEISGNKFISSVHTHKKKIQNTLYVQYTCKANSSSKGFFLNTVYIYIVRLGCDCFIWNWRYSCNYDTSNQII